MRKLIWSSCSSPGSSELETLVRVAQTHETDAATRHTIYFSPIMSGFYELVEKGEQTFWYASEEVPV